ncbi:MMPL family transporter [Azoarcus taiwanensis]|uniref:Membrane transport protein MMPL domain-containing protein n=1 Tax=Azoarcus taiwanensis TaxID=666964 RepID=A0A972FKA0_9RHOO|nr:hypothetical protein [Azoarcus taiwanensis]NMG03841.1 hypothetical protein [Azoarcus taiwanensis]
MRLRTWIWLACAAIVVTWTGLRFTTQPPIETDLLALLPATERNSLAEEAAAQLGRLAGERAIFLIGLPTPEAARAAAADFAAAIDGPPFHRIVTIVPQPDSTALIALYEPHRTGLLPEPLSATPDLAADLSDLLEARLASPFGGGALPLADDPFGLFDAWLSTLPFLQSRLHIDDGWLSVRDASTSWVLISAELGASAFDPLVQITLTRVLEIAEDTVSSGWPEARILRAGAVFHAMNARANAEREIRLIGGGSLFAIVILLILVYRSPGPLALGLLSVGIGVSAGALATVSLFGSIHLMTLVFGASLIGEAIDYSIQYFSARLGAAADWDPGAGLKAITPALSIALATSVVGYSALALTAFPAMQQIAVFAISGLAAAWLTVVIVLPALLRKPQSAVPGRLLDLPGRLLQAWRRHGSLRVIMVSAILLVLAAAPGWWQLQTDDDIRQLITSDPSLAAQEQQLRTLTGFEPSSQFFLVTGEDEEELLQREEALTRALAAQRIDLQAVSRFVPSCHGQRESHARVKAISTSLHDTLLSVGFRESSADAWVSRQSMAPPCLTVTQWLASPVSTPFRHLWLDGADRHPASLALPTGYADVALLATAIEGLSGVTLVDKPGAVSSLFGEYRRLAGYAIAGATTLILLLLVGRYGVRGAVTILLPPVLAQAVTLGVLGYAGTVINLFNVLALLLVLGVGINYAIFMYESTAGSLLRESAALTGIMLSATTTLLSFGLLSLSSMPALAGFGSTLTLGIAVAVLLAPSALVMADR